MIIYSGILFDGAGGFERDKSIVLDESGQVQEILSGSHPEVAVSYDAVCPGFINAHCHTELSHMKGVIPESVGIASFIKKIQAVRHVSDEEQRKHQLLAMKTMEKAGIVGLGDICNSAVSLPGKAASELRIHNFIELFGFDESQADDVFKRGEILKELFEKSKLSASLSPHSPYSVSEKLMRMICEKEKGLLSIHMLESGEEVELFKEGTGPLAEQLRDFGINIDNWEFPGVDPLTHFSSYFENRKALMVHATQIHVDPIQAAVNSNIVNFCTCPNANIYIENQLPDYELLMKHNMNILVGTDSLASNHQLSIWSELECIKLHNRQLRIEELLKWACSNGANFFGWDELGSITPGKTPGIVALRRNPKTAVGFSLHKRII